MRIAILGAGFAGLATAWHLLNYTRASITIDLYDPIPIGEGVSGISSGLLHAYTGKRAFLSWEAKNAFKEVHNLLTVSSQAIKSSLVLSKGILRPAVTEQQISDFQRAGTSNPDVEWWSKSQCENSVPGLVLPENGGGLYEKEGLTLDVPLYLEGLWQACALLGTQWLQRAISHSNELEGYDRILIALGSEIAGLLQHVPLPIELIKGQILELSWPSEVQPLPFSIVSAPYLVMDKSNTFCLAGATYERQFKDRDPHPEEAWAQIVTKIIPFFPAIEKSRILGCRVGVRVSTKSHLPIVGKLSDKFWIFTGLGSKGLLYHAWLGMRLAHALLFDNPKSLPKEVYHPIEQLTKREPQPPS